MSIQVNMKNSRGPIYPSHLLQKNGDCVEITHAVEKVGPQIELVCPSKGPASGGTNVFIWGKRLDGIIVNSVGNNSTEMDNGAGRRKRQLAGDTTTAVVDLGGNNCWVLFRYSTISVSCACPEVVLPVIFQ